MEKQMDLVLRSVSIIAQNEYVDDLGAFEILVEWIGSQVLSDETLHTRFLKKETHLYLISCDFSCLTEIKENIFRLFKLTFNNAVYKKRLVLSIYRHSNI